MGAAAKAAPDLRLRKRAPQKTAAESQWPIADAEAWFLKLAASLKDDDDGGLGAVVLDAMGHSSDGASGLTG